MILISIVVVIIEITSIIINIIIIIIIVVAILLVVVVVIVKFIIHHLIHQNQSCHPYTRHPQLWLRRHTSIHLSIQVQITRPHPWRDSIWLLLFGVLSSVCLGVLSSMVRCLSVSVSLSLEPITVSSIRKKTSPGVYTVLCVSISVFMFISTSASTSASMSVSVSVSISVSVCFYICFCLRLCL